MRRLTNQTQPRRTSDVNRECGTESADRRWLRCFVRRYHVFLSINNTRNDAIVFKMYHVFVGRVHDNTAMQLRRVSEVIDDPDGGGGDAQAETDKQDETEFGRSG